jgi:hypothetical protein
MHPKKLIPSNVSFRCLLCSYFAASSSTSIMMRDHLSLTVYTVTITCGSDVTGFDAVRVGRGMPRAPVPFCGCGGTPHGRGSFAERTVSGGRLSGRGKKEVAKQTGVATRGPLFTLCTKRGVGTAASKRIEPTLAKEIITNSYFDKGI